MATSKCPMCKTPCIIKIIATSDSRWKEVDVCEMCGTMYPRDRSRKSKSPGKGKKPAKKAARKPAKKKKTAR